MAQTYKEDERPNLLKEIDAARINADPVGPPAAPPIPGPSRADRGGGRTVVEDAGANPSGAFSDPGFTRPVSGPNSAAAQSPAIPAPTANPTAGPAPVIASVTPATAANAPALEQAGLTRPGAAPVAAPTPPTPPRPSGPLVLSDGTAGIARTVTPEQITALGKRNIVDGGIGGGIASEAAGGTLDLGDGAGVLPARPAPAASGAQTAIALQEQAQRNAASDLASIANRDPRSVLGSAARNADVEANSVDGSRAQRAKTLAALEGVAGAPVTAASKLGSDIIQDAGASARTAATVAGQENEARIRASDRQAQTITLADGTLGIVRPDGSVTEAKGPGGLPVRPQVGKPAIDLPAYATTHKAFLDRFLGADPVSGMVTDKTTGKQRLPTPSEISRASDAATAETDKIFSKAGASSAAPERPVSLKDFVDKARKVNPTATDAELEAFYRKNYGS